MKCCSQYFTTTKQSAEECKPAATVGIRIVGTGRSFWRSEWSEAKDGTGIEYLPRLFQELELRAQWADNVRRAEEEKRLRTLGEWKAAQRKARGLFIRDKKLSLLHDQVQRRGSSRSSNPKPGARFDRRF